MRRLLVTGGAGFIGSNFVRYWLENHPEDRVVVFDAFTYAGNQNNLVDLDTDHLRICIGDICEDSQVLPILRNEYIDTVVHFAAESHVDRSIHGPDAFVRTNVLGTQTLLHATLRVSRERPGRIHFHHVSTDEVYGALGPEDSPFTEQTPYAPNSPYSASKAGSDHLVRAYHRTYDLPVTISNCSNNYGPYQYPEKLLPVLITKALDGEPLPIYGDGNHIRDWLHVEDHCRAIDRILSDGRNGEVYLVGGREERTNLQITRLLCEELDRIFGENPDWAERYPNMPAAGGKSSHELLCFVADRAGHDRRYGIDPGKIESELGFKADIGLREGLRSTILWYLHNEAWWRELQAKHAPRPAAQAKAG